MKEFRFCKVPLAFFCLLACAGLAAFFVVACFSKPNDSDPLGAVILSIFTYFFWLMGRSSVRMNNEGVIIDSFLIRTRIPWSDLADISVGYGLEFRFRSGGKAGSIMYGGSLLGKLTGDRYLKRVAARMQDARKEITSRLPEAVGVPQTTTSGYHASLWPPTMILGLMEIIAVLAIVAK